MSVAKATTEFNGLSSDYKNKACYLCITANKIPWHKFVTIQG